RIARMPSESTDGPGEIPVRFFSSPDGPRAESRSARHATPKEFPAKEPRAKDAPAFYYLRLPGQRIAFSPEIPADSRPETFPAPVSAFTIFLPGAGMRVEKQEI